MTIFLPNHLFVLPIMVLLPMAK